MLKQFPFFSALRLFPLVKYVLSLIFDCDFFSSIFVYFFSVIIKNINGRTAFGNLCNTFISLLY